jgi:putative tricarboxylic transport membrane protein
VKLNDALSGAALVALGAVVLWHIQGFPPMPGQKYGPAWFPGLIAVGLIVCGALLVAARLRAASPEPLLAMPGWTRRARPVASVVSVIAGLVAYVLLADTLGFHIIAAALLLVWSRLMGASWRLAVPVAIAATLVIQLSFYKLLKVPLPWGVFERFAF